MRKSGAHLRKFFEHGLSAECLDESGYSKPPEVNFARDCLKVCEKLKRKLLANELTIPPPPFYHIFQISSWIAFLFLKIRTVRNETRCGTTEAMRATDFQGVHCT